MKLIKFPLTTEFSNLPKVFTLGKFESIHKGHRNLIQLAEKISSDKGYELGMMLFSERKTNNIFSLKERMAFLNAYDIEYIWEFEPISDNFKYTHEEFEKMLLDMNVKIVVVGSDFKYGNNRMGSIETLKTKFEVVTLEKNKYSTSEVMNSIIDVDLNKYKEMMGHYFFYEGKVLHGKENGRKFGMPTVNVQYPEYKIDISDGIYYSYLIYNGKRLPSLTSISFNPTLNANHKTYETYIYDFNEDIYNKKVYVELIEKFRDPIKFESIDELITQLEKDKIRGRKYFHI